MHEQTGWGAQMPQNWSYGSEVPLTGERVLFFSSWREQQKYTNIQIGCFLVSGLLVSFVFSPPQRSARHSLEREGIWGERAILWHRYQIFLCNTYVSYTASIKAQNSFTTFNDLALYDQQMCFFYSIYSGLLCCAHFPKVIAMHCLV